MYGRGKSWEIEKEQSKYSLKTFLFYSRKETNNFKHKTEKITMSKTMFNADKHYWSVVNILQIVCVPDFRYIIYR